MTGLSCNRAPNQEEVASAGAGAGAGASVSAGVSR